jgi:hypothetical protein
VSKFRVGDRVRRIGSECFVPVGTFGTVITPARSDGSITIEWEWCEDKSSYDLQQQSQWLELVPPSACPTVEMAISLYTLACERYEAAQLELDRAKDAVRDARLALRDALDADQ